MSLLSARVMQADGGRILTSFIPRRDTPLLPVDGSPLMCMVPEAPRFVSIRPQKAQVIKMAPPEHRAEPLEQDTVFLPLDEA